MSERRRSARRKRFLRGCVYFDNRRSALDCLICDISDNGARIIVSRGVSFPDVLEVYIPQKEQTKRAQVRWRHGTEIGLSFSDAMCSDGPPTAVGAVAHDPPLEPDNSSLRRVLKRLQQRFLGLLVGHKPDV